MNKLGRNTLALGLSTLLITSAVSFSANAADETKFKVHAEAQFISAGDQALGQLLNPLAEQIEGVEATGDPAADSPAAGPFSSTQANDELLSLPIEGLAGLTLGAVNNYGGGNVDTGLARAASGAVSDSGTINTGGGGDFPADLNLSLSEGQLTGPIASTLADLDLSLGAISSSIQQTGPDGTPERDYNIAGGRLTLDVPLLEVALGGLSTAIGETIGDINNINTTAICGQITGVAGLSALCGALGGVLELDINVPSLNSVLGNVTNLSAGGVTANLENGTVTVDIDATLAAAGLDRINDLDEETDLLAYVLPAVVTQLNTLVSNLSTGLVANITANSSITVSLLGGLVPPVTLDGTALKPLLDPILAGLTAALPDVTGPLAQGLGSLVNALAPLLQVLVNNPDLADTTLVGDENGDAIGSQTAVRVLVANGQAADLRLATSVIGPIEDVVISDDQGDAQDVQDDGPGNTDGAVADSDNDAQADAASDADAAADADVTTTLPATGAPNLMPFWLLGLGLVLFGAAVLINERRRLKI